MSLFFFQKLEYYAAVTTNYLLVEICEMRREVAEQLTLWFALECTFLLKADITSPINPVLLRIKPI
ncbi:hypothetical protein BEN49_19405 [Hymenobacter coccineus]|uniref:Uncharacterized protein n=1 Tax=Hymenobacter coccineus TaxID=1908235 RepID=A0A1G1TKZ1_9BACT|nr:hypothetical protein BEN49_19405 [Hymenobacter coccineus]